MTDRETPTLDKRVRERKRKSLGDRESETGQRDRQGQRSAHKRDKEDKRQ